MMTNGDPEGRIFLYHPHTNNVFFFLPTIKYRILCLKRFSKVSEYAEVRHDMMPSLDDQLREFQHNQSTALT